jgi:hypothetical protein
MLDNKQFNLKNLLTLSQGDFTKHMKGRIITASHGMIKVNPALVHLKPK